MLATMCITTGTICCLINLGQGFAFRFEGNPGKKPFVGPLVLYFVHAFVLRQSVLPTKSVLQVSDWRLDVLRWWQMLRGSSPISMSLTLKFHLPDALRFRSKPVKFLAHRRIHVSDQPDERSQYRCCRRPTWFYTPEAQHSHIPINTFITIKKDSLLLFWPLGVFDAGCLWWTSGSVLSVLSHGICFSLRDHNWGKFGKVSRTWQIEITRPWYWDNCMCFLEDVAVKLTWLDLGRYSPLLQELKTAMLCQWS